MLTSSAPVIGKDPTKFIVMVFHAAHNIKGTARSLNINDVADISHYIESIFSSLQNKKLKITPTIVNLCFEAANKMRLAMQCYLKNQPLPFDLANLLIRLEKKRPEDAAKVPTKGNIKPTKEQKIKRQSPNIKGHPIQSNQETTQKIKKETIAVKPRSQSPTIKPQKNNSESPQTIQKKPTSFPPNKPIVSTTHETIRVSIENLDRIAALMEEIQVNKITISGHYEELNRLASNMTQLMQLWQQVDVAQKDISSTTNRENLQKTYSLCNDRLIEMNQSIHQLDKMMRLRINELTVLSHSLQEDIRMLRLIPATSLLQTLPRAVRDLAIEMNKKVELSITGDEIKMDKMVLEGLKDPLIHLLRNAIDHGIEAPAIRKAKGKTEMGHIWLDVVEEGNQILMRIKDDGGGINIDEIAAIYEKKNLLSIAELQNMNQTDRLELIFRPGFSTREIITTISGRGIGLHVVKENITLLKGQVHVTSELDKGTTFDLRVPLTLTSERGLIVRCGGQLFVIPTVSVQKVLSVETNDVIEVGASQAILIDKHPVPLRSLANILDLECREPLLNEQLTLVVMQHGWDKIAVLVEEIIGEQEIVVKPMQAPINDIPGITGGTLSASGQVMIVLNPNDIISMILQKSEMTPINIQDDDQIPPVQTHILVVDDSITTRTLEKSILENKGYHVTTAVDGKEAWEILQKQPFSLLITDVMMPNVDGFTLTERVKKTEKLQNLPVIIVTSLGNDSEKKRGIEVGADAYIVKSEFESGILLEIVEQLV